MNRGLNLLLFGGAIYAMFKAAILIACGVFYGLRWVVRSAVAAIAKH